MANEILMLNDYCILEICKYISLHDLANFKEAYGSLGAVVDLSFDKKTRGRLLLDWKISSDQFLQIIKQFGPSINRLDICKDDLNESKWSDIFTVIDEHCNEKLKSLILCGDAVELITKDDVLLIVNILKNVEAIELRPFLPNGTKEYINILSYCENARWIALYNSFSNIDIDLHKEIFRQKRKMTKLNLNCSLKKDNDLKQIIDNLVNTPLEVLGVNFLDVTAFDENLLQLRRLNYLKLLSINCNKLDISPFVGHLDAFDSLNALSLSSTKLNESAIATLGRMSRLNLLNLSDTCGLETSSKFESLRVLCGNKNLVYLIFLCDLVYFDTNRQLWIIDYAILDKLKFQIITDTRKASTAGHCLHLTLSNYNYITSLKAIPPELLEANKNVIKLIDKEEDPNSGYYDINYKFM